MHSFLYSIVAFPQHRYHSIIRTTHGLIKVKVMHLIKYLTSMEGIFSVSASTVQL